MDSLSQAVETALGAQQPAAETAAAATAERPAAAAAKPEKRIDHHLWGTYLLLVMIALIELFSASVQEVQADDIFSPLIRHGRFIGIGLILMLLLQWVHYRFIFKFTPLFVAFAVGMMIAVRGGGEDINGAVRSITIMGTPILPSEFMKLAVALGMAYILAKTQVKGKRDVSWAGLWISLAFLLGCAGLLFSQGLSNTIITVGIGGAMMFVGGMGWKKIGIAALIVGVLGLGAYKYKTSAEDKTEFSERQELVNQLNHTDTDTIGGAGRGKVWNKRVDDFYRPNKHLEPFSLEHQQEQLSFIAQAHGHILGVGPGKSREAARLPLAYSDYVFAIIVEELGLIGGLFILLIYVWILGRSAKLTLQFKHTMPGVLVMGCSFVIVFQALYHMAIVSGVIPVSGQPLPLISKGGISVLATSLTFGVMLSVARHAVHVTDSKQAQRIEHDLLPESAQGVNPALREGAS